MAATLRLGICGSASVGKTTLAHALAQDLDLPCLEEEMRAYLEHSGTDLSRLPSSEVEHVVLTLWQQRQRAELATPAFVADNCSIDFAAYALYYGCLSYRSSEQLLVQARRHLESYDAIVLLPWGVLPYLQDGVRTSNQHLQLRYQLLLEGLLRRYVPPQKLHPLPESILHLDARKAWVLDRLRESVAVSPSCQETALEFAR